MPEKIKYGTNCVAVQKLRSVETQCDCRRV